ncbi:MULTISPECIES: IS30 family transposase [Alteromonas]|jgi:IS30 family transposase|uniref:Integrase n=2 Tax=Alteromonas TaxID=226 RepID=A0AAC8XN02_9ALTE|nr:MULTISPECIES: IS30 family transposase [Alteromonas]AFV86813.1 transposase ISSba17 protein [Alteromonas mediterranea DE1]AFV86841.1 transposase ISSba17 protein [Alteromonas mediterranea DE1]AGP98827.1 transposase ISSba17 protein [Alteromonas mediterranea UM7]AGP98855.1 transposase ISSba17 protein [Alteromonas mediterranea UM7]AGQ03026.1 transposase ISSba17 protein [Alteromonas mediterranea UM4b]|tara:strand:+ start:2914 stop:3864 length:951 start_codon:yes stop_codon:yes gene_type:complete
MRYKQLIEGQRYQIEAYLREGFSYREIGKRLQVSHSTISREVRRNRIRDNHYLPEVAHAKTVKRRGQAAKYSVPALTITFVEFGLSQKWSPEQIAGVGKIIGHSVSHEWIYGYIQRDKLRGGKLFKQLRHGHRKYRKGSRAKRVIIPNRVGIECRPAIVNKKKRFGDWEADTVLGKNGTGAIVSLVERKSKLYLIRKVPAKTAADVGRAMVGMLWRYRGHVRTITADNGAEFCAHALVADKLKTDIYFANPYSSWERGLNENFNGLLRQYIRKGTDLRTVTDKQIADVERALNARPRKCLGFKQPALVFKQLRDAA